MNLREGAEFFGLKSAGALCNIEQGKTFPTPETISLIYGATNGEVTADDHFRAWQRANPQFKALRAAGRSAAKSFRKPAAKRRK